MNKGASTAIVQPTLLDGEENAISHRIRHHLQRVAVKRLRTTPSRLQGPLLPEVMFAMYAYLLIYNLYK